jgi:hypothetical protein
MDKAQTEAGSRARTNLSKSRITAFEQCPKRLWLEVYRRDLLAFTARSEAVFAVGHAVGAISQAAYPDGIMIGPDDNLAKAIDMTTALLQSGDRRPLFEATFSYKDVLVRVDLLLPLEDGWHMAEVKSTASVKAYHLLDLATQVWVAQGAGLKISRASIRHINTHFSYQTLGDYGGLLKDADQLAAITESVSRRQIVIEAAKQTLLGDEPIKAVGPQCTEPFDCPFIGYCQKDLPAGPKYPVSLLPNAAGKKAAKQMEASGFKDLRDVPEDYDPAPALRRLHMATRAGIAYLDQVGMDEAIRAWDWPRYYLDFETINFAIPRWLGFRPFQSVPFQYSCHRQEQDGTLDHSEFLDLSGQDPSRACAEALLAQLGNLGAIITYNAPTERGAIRALASQFADLSDRLNAIAERIVDLLPLVKAHYYHPDMLGSYSIKAVLPARLPDLPHLSYAALDGVKDGLAAQSAYAEAIAPDCLPQVRERLRAELLQYCALDTLAMVALTQSFILPSAYGRRADGK